MLELETPEVRERFYIYVCFEWFFAMVCDEKAHGRLGALIPHLIAQVFEDAASRVALLSRRFSVGFEPLVDLRPHRSRQDKPLALGLLSRRRDRIRQRLADDTPMHDTFTRDGTRRLAADEVISPNGLK